VTLFQCMYIIESVQAYGRAQPQELENQRTCNFHIELKTHKWILPRTPRKLQPNSNAPQRLHNLAPRKLNMVALHSSCLISCVIFCVVQRAQKVHEATKFAFVQLNEHKRSLFDKTHLEGEWIRCGREFHMT